MSLDALLKGSTGTEQADTTQGAAPVTDETPTEPTDYLKQYVGEGAKYKTVEELAKAYAHADNLIAFQKAENEKLTSAMTELELKTKTIDDVLSLIGTGAEDTATPAPSQPQVNNKPITEVVNEVFIQRKRAEEVERNKQEAHNLLVETFGQGNAALAVQAFIKGSPTKEVLVKQLAESDPRTLLELIKVNATNIPNNPTGSSGGVSQPPIYKPAISWTDACKLKRDNPKEYQRQLPTILNEASLMKSKGLDYYTT